MSERIVMVSSYYSAREYGEEKKEVGRIIDEFFCKDISDIIFKYYVNVRALKHLISVRLKEN